jgi:hypothetical protein
MEKMPTKRHINQANSFSLMQATSTTTRKARYSSTSTAAHIQFSLVRMCAPGKQVVFVLPKEALNVVPRTQIGEAQKKEAAPKAASAADNKPEEVLEQWKGFASYDLIFPQLRTPLAFLGI